MASCPEFVVALAVVAVVFFGYLGAVVDHFAVCLYKVVPHLPPADPVPASLTLPPHLLHLPSSSAPPTLLLLNPLHIAPLPSPACAYCGSLADPLRAYCKPRMVVPTISPPPDEVSPSLSNAVMPCSRRLRLCLGLCLCASVIVPMFLLPSGLRRDRHH